jgi:5'-methylthioadenosine phosphorylase
LAGRSVAFLARHGVAHEIMPSEVNYRANVFALKQLGVERILSISACGSLRQDYAPGQVVIPDQLLDWTHGRPRTFFGDGAVVHVSVADPFCPRLSEWCLQSVRAAGGVGKEGGAMITIEGPRFSTRAESNTYRSWGMALIGMTTSPEAFLAREAEMCYAVMAHVTDYDVWHTAEEPVTVEVVVRTLRANAELVQRSLLDLLPRLSAERDCECGHALAGAIVTPSDRIPAETRRRISLLVDRYLL